MKIRFIFNPCAGFNARNPRLLAQTHRFIEHHKLEADVAITARARHGTELARKAIDDGCHLVVAIGGDGTMNEVAAALVGTQTTLGLIPCGSGNGLGRHLGITGPTRDAFDNLLHGRIRTIDTGEVNGLPFFNAMGVGFDATVSSQFNGRTRRGFRSYVSTVATAFAGFRPEAYSIRSAHADLDVSAFLLCVANSDQYGNNCFIAPGARVDDGQLDLIAISNVNLLTAAPLAVRLFTRTIGSSKQVRQLRGTSFSIERSAAGVVHTDGEVHETTARIDVCVRPHSLRIMVPA
jgi:diacylglycerol kinase (ATP)